MNQPQLLLLLQERVNSSFKLCFCGNCRCSCQEQEDEIDEEVVKDMFGGKDHVSIIFMGHVDAGKSTMGEHFVLDRIC